MFEFWLEQATSNSFLEFEENLWVGSLHEKQPFCKVKSNQLTLPLKMGPASLPPINKMSRKSDKYFVKYLLTRLADVYEKNGKQVEV